MQELLSSVILTIFLFLPSWVIFYYLERRNKFIEKFDEVKEEIEEEKYEIIPLKSYKFRGYILIPSIKNTRKNKEFKRYYNY